MRVSVILTRKGSEVATIRPDATVTEAAETMTQRDIGALVVSPDGVALDGIVSERDIVRCIPGLGDDCLHRPVSEIMTTQVTTCDLDTSVDELMATMTDHRIRHMPVVVDGALSGIVSIGDVVKSRLDELELQASTLEQYVTGSRA